MGQQSRDRRPEHQQGREHADRGVDNQAVAEVVAAREVGIGNRSDSFPGR